jgi:hypothetical protein
VRSQRSVITAVLVAAVLTACTTPSVSTTAEQAAPAPLPSAPLVDGAKQTIWTVAGAGTSLPDDDPAVTAIRRLVVVNSGEVDTRNSSTIAKSVDREFSYYTTTFVERLRKADYPSELEKLFVDNALATSQQAVAWFPSEISADGDNATANFESTIRFTAGTDTYLSQRNLKLERNYTQVRKVSLLKVQGTWLIDNIEKGNLEEVSASGDVTN